ncbi:hypothetical protein MIND_01268700 [Mycena indigotica]|uniref:26S proteasome non-ATPase regulatory subunit 5 n=1 Tax=Mycena indigotica TaxID=2126181 RepID=A0A8H6S4P0_9AGAR|nr:uncharacterized protein MIND_01268700 [Mycena indigotica]KAF7291250.1 hypothetical protein MIND_01268700 [Mycena indigotica]
MDSIPKLLKIEGYHEVLITADIINALILGAKGESEAMDKVLESIFPPSDASHKKQPTTGWTQHTFLEQAISDLGNRTEYDLWIEATKAALKNDQMKNFLHQTDSVKLIMDCLESVDKSRKLGGLELLSLCYDTDILHFPVDELNIKLLILLDDSNLQVQEGSLACIKAMSSKDIMSQPKIIRKCFQLLEHKDHNIAFSSLKTLRSLATQNQTANYLTLPAFKRICEFVTETDTAFHDVAIDCIQRLSDFDAGKQTLLSSDALLYLFGRLNGTHIDSQILKVIQIILSHGSGSTTVLGIIIDHVLSGLATGPENLYAEYMKLVQNVPHEFNLPASSLKLITTLLNDKRATVVQHVIQLIVYFSGQDNYQALLLSENTWEGLLQQPETAYLVPLFLAARPSTIHSVQLAASSGIVPQLLNLYAAPELESQVVGLMGMLALDLT